MDRIRRAIIELLGALTEYVDGHQSRLSATGVENQNLKRTNEHLLDRIRSLERQLAIKQINQTEKEVKENEQKEFKSVRPIEID